MLPTVELQLQVSAFGTCMQTSQGPLWGYVATLQQSSHIATISRRSLRNS